MTVTVTSALAGPATARYSNVYGALVDLGVLSGRGAQDVTGSGDPVAPILNAAGFYAPLTHSLILTRGSGNPTYTRATAAWEFDNEGKLILVPSTSARFGGARMVRNLLTYTEDLSNAAWTKLANATVTGTNQVNLTADANSRVVQYSASGTAKTGDTITFSALLSGTGQCYLSITEDTAPYPTVSSSLITLSSTPTRYFVTITHTVGGLRDIAVVTKLALASGATVIVQEPQLENVTGQADQTASEYVSANVLSAPYHGAGVDGVKWFATNKDGSAISASSLLGYHAEGARTNNLLYSRDLTNAAWAATNITPAKTATGIDNAANSASTLTAGAADATILQTLSMAAAARSFSAYVKRRTGTGNVYITRDGGTNWTDITSSLGASWTRVKIENTSVLNPVCGFKIATSGDAIDVDVCQDEAGPSIASPIVTTTAAVTRNADFLDYATTNVSANSTFAGTWNTPTLANSTIQTIIGTKTSSTEGFGKKATSNNFYIANPSETMTVAGSALVVNTFNKFAGTLNGTTRSVSSNGGAVSSAADASSWTASKLRINGDGWGGQSQGYLKNVYIWSTALTDAQLQQVTA